MATTREGGVGGGGGGGRRGNPSSTPQAKYKPPTKPSTSTSTSQPKPPSTKPLPNYLKPTISSSLDPSSSTTSRTARRAAKPATAPRRRSLDKPPSPTNPPKALRGPTNTDIAINTNTRDVVKTVARNTLSSSTAVKSALPPPKPAPHKSFSSLSTSRATKPASAAPAVKRSLSAKAAPTNPSANVRRVVKKTSPRSVEPEARDKDPFDHLIGQGQDEDDHDHEVQSLHDISEMPDPEDQLGDPVMVDQENATEKQSVEEEQDEESIEPADHDDDEEEGASEGVDSTKVEEKHVVVVLADEGSEEGEQTKAAAEDQVAEPESPATAKQAYNDVIEETASKLMERSNKVRALAGAFETVISLDSQ